MCQKIVKLISLFCMIPLAGTWAQINLKSNELIKDAWLERQVLGQDQRVWSSVSAADRLQVPATVCLPGAYTLSFHSGDLSFQSTIIIERGPLTISVNTSSTDSSAVSYSLADGRVNNAYAAYLRREADVVRDYKRYEGLTAAYSNIHAVFRKELNSWWAGRMNSWDAYRNRLLQQWGEGALSQLVRSSWSGYAGYPATVRGALPSSLPPLYKLTWNANLIEGKDIEYLRLLLPTPAKDASALTDTMLRYLPVLLDRAVGNDSLLQYWTYNLGREAKQAGLDEVRELLDTRYLAGTCTAGDDKDLQLRLQAYKTTRKGMIAPPIKQADFNLYTSVVADTTIIVFWASWCPHCSDDLPKLHEILKHRPGTKVVAVALDEQEDSWLRSKASLSGWNHIRAAGKWDDELVLPYGIYATPTLFVLDKDKRILKKCNSIGCVL